MQKIKIAFLGGGINSAVGKTHKIAAEMDNKYEIVAGCFSKNEDINKKTADIYGVEKFYRNLEDLIKYEKNNIDVISILTPIPNHKEEVIYCIKNNIPVICEKALTTSYENALEIKRSLDEYNGFLAITYNYTGYPMIRELKEIIKNGALGDIIHIDIQMPQESFLKVDKNNNPLKPQEWRLKDYEIPTIYLDLGTHLHDLISFLIEKEPLEVTAINNIYGYFNVVDDVRGVVKYYDDIIANYWFSKSALGHTNGLKVHIYGKKGSAYWCQLEPENLYLYDNKGNKKIMDRASSECIIANQERYNRFKAGHPAGFIEAFANYYYDIAEMLLSNQQDNKYVFGIDNALEGFMLLESMNESNKLKDWVNVAKR